MKIIIDSAQEDYDHPDEDKRVGRAMYHVEVSWPGSPRVWFFGHELTLDPVLQRRGF